MNANEQIREAFEAWYRETSGYAWSESDLERMAVCGQYDNGMVHDLWEAWQAATRAANQWLPIESAPRDEEVLVYGVIHHSDEHKKNTNIETTKIVTIGRFLSISGGKGVWCGVLGGKPTHWMPLPAAPIGDKEGV